MAILAQLVRVPDCGSEGRGFESHRSPQNKKKAAKNGCFFNFTIKNQLVIFVIINIS